MFYEWEMRQRERFVPGDSKYCDQCGVQLQTRAGCRQCGPDGLVALALCRLHLQLEHVVQVCCSVQSLWEMPPENESFLSPPSSHPTTGDGQLVQHLMCK